MIKFKDGKWLYYNRGTLEYFETQEEAVYYKETGKYLEKEEVVYVEEPLDEPAP